MVPVLAVLLVLASVVKSASTNKCGNCGVTILFEAFAQRISEM
jgi:hypothetical protein